MKIEGVEFKIKQRVIAQVNDAYLEEGKIHFIVGKNGAGKTSLLKILSGLEKNYTGDIHFLGRNLSDWSTEDLAQRRAVLSQSNFNAFPIKVEELVMMGRYPYFKQNASQRDKEIVAEAINLFNLDEFVGRDFLSLSGGERQRVLFAKCIAQVWGKEQHRKYLFLDEPLTYLDVEYQVQFLRLLHELIDRFNLTVVGVIHDINLAVNYGENFLLMHKGKCVEQGSASEVLNLENMRKYFRVSPEVIASRSSNFFVF
ncbi:ABC transporter ATP-binding protein [Lishizhenia sp.]|uniref:ABC transporter ATP-binding protein n=1 Tax=Lishizhenia sp. TaxID=2497594 RepID=UPI00299D5F01|nr:ABC transporter ATP-binding protein [Lishizhenia sp.]MDX1446472.1 ABC transporter ATP-binding protein [Lishizhenia sp.]